MKKIERYLKLKGIQYAEHDDIYSFEIGKLLYHVSSNEITINGQSGHSTRYYNTIAKTIEALDKRLNDIPEAPTPEQIVTVGSSSLMNTISIAASTMGKKGGSAKSDRKAKSSAENGKKGGRPRKE